MIDEKLNRAGGRMSAFDPLQTLANLLRLELVEPHETVEQNRVEGTGCAWALLVLDTLLMGLVAFSFVQGPYSSRAQALWYRYGSLGFFLVGAVLPAIALLAARHSRWVVIAAAVWMLSVLLGFARFAIVSGGGV